MNNNYDMRITGTIDGITKVLTDLLEKQNTGFNLNYKMKIKDVNWFTNMDETSTARVKAGFDRELERRDLRIFQDTYNVVLNFGAGS